MYRTKFLLICSFWSNLSRSCFRDQTRSIGVIANHLIRMSVLCVLTITSDVGERAWRTKSPVIRGKRPREDVWVQHPLQTHHDGAPRGRLPVFRMRVTEVFGNDCLLRQVTEPKLIDNACTKGECINSWAEWNHQTVPRITIIDDWCACTIYRGRRGDTHHDCTRDVEN